MRRIMVDRTELLTMREQGMTNNEIAESLGIDRSTVYNYIGGMPEELKRKSRSASYKLKTLNEAKAIERAKFDAMVPNYETEVLTKRIKANNITIDMNCKSGSCNVSVSFESNNQVSIDGRICKLNDIRTTKNGKHNIHFIKLVFVFFQIYLFLYLTTRFA